MQILLEWLQVAADQNKHWELLNYLTQFSAKTCKGKYVAPP